MITFKRRQWLLSVPVSVLVAGLAWGGEKAVAVHIRSGDINTLAVGEHANAAVNLGGVANRHLNGCVKTNVKYGDIHRIAVGRNATATVNLPPSSFRCEEK